MIPPQTALRKAIAKTVRILKALAWATCRPNAAKTSSVAATIASERG